MPVIYELPRKTAAYAELGLNLYSGCAVGCRYCSGPWFRHLTWERWTHGAQPRRNILVQLKREAKKMEGDPREIIVGPAADPYQSDEAALLTRKALLILEQYRLRVQMATLCGMRSVVDFDILARNRWKYGTAILFRSERLREEWEPGGANRRAGPSDPRSACGGNLHLGENLSRSLSSRADRGRRVAPRRCGRVEDRQSAPRRTTAESDCQSTTRPRRRRHRFGLSSPYGREGVER